MSDNHADSVVELLNVSKEFYREKIEIPVLTNTTLHIPTRRLRRRHGAQSGSGKSTLLNLCAGLDRPTTGQVIVNGQDLGELSEARPLEVAQRESRLHLPDVQPDAGAHGAGERRAAAVAHAAVAGRAAEARRRRRCGSSAWRIGPTTTRGSSPAGRSSAWPSPARWPTIPVLLLADEPTGNLDATSAQEMLDLLEQLNEQFGTTIIMVTHDPKAARRAKRLLHLEKGTFVQADIEALEAAR